jgi:U3 small nucleolar RNA-associated protein 19
MAPSSLPKSLKRKAAPAAYDDGSQYTIENVAQLEAQLNAAVQAGGSFNALADLVALARASDASAQATSKAIYALYRVQAVLLSAGTLSPGGDAAARTARAWVWDRLNAYTDILCGLLQDEDKALRVFIRMLHAP